jgi:aconitate decarboxylase
MHQFAPARIDQQDIWDLVPCITAHHRAEYDELGAMGRGQTEVRVILRDGRVLTSAQFAARSVLQPLTNAAVVEKFRRLTSSVVATGRRDALLDVVTSLEDRGSLIELERLLAPVVCSPFDTGRPS